MPPIFKMNSWVIHTIVCQIHGYFFSSKFKNLELIFILKRKQKIRGFLLLENSFQKYNDFWRNQIFIYQVKRLTRVLEATARALFTNFAVFIKANLSGLNSWGLLMRKSREKIWNWWRCQMSIIRTKERCREIRGIFPTSSFFPILEVNWPRFSLISLQMMLGTMGPNRLWCRSQKKKYFFALKICQTTYCCVVKGLFNIFWPTN